MVVVVGSKAFGEGWFLQEEVILTVPATLLWEAFTELCCLCCVCPAPHNWDQMRLKTKFIPYFTFNQICSFSIPKHTPKENKENKTMQHRQCNMKHTQDLGHACRISRGHQNHSVDITAWQGTQQQRPESPTITFIWHAHTHKADTTHQGRILDKECSSVLHWYCQKC